MDGCSSKTNRPTSQPSNPIHKAQQQGSIAPDSATPDKDTDDGDTAHEIIKSWVIGRLGLVAFGVFALFRPW